MSTARPKSSSWLFPTLLALAVLLRLLAWWAGTVTLPPSSDESIAMLLARDVLAGRFPLLFLAQPYLFPLESSLAAPLALLPPAAWVCRLIPFALGLLTTWLALRLVQDEGSLPVRIVAGLLAVMPSVYVLILQGFYAPPGYSFLLLLCVLLPALALRARATGLSRWAWLAGLLASLGFAAHSLSLCVSLPVLLVLALPAADGRFLRRILATASGLLLGALPYLVARLSIEGAHLTATALRPGREILARVWAPTMTHILPGAMGFRAVPFPDTKATAFLLPLNGNLFAGGIALLLTGVALWRLVVHLRCVLARRWPDGQAVDLLLAAVLLNLVLVAAAPRADSSSYRYLAPAALLIPLLLACTLRSAPTGLRHLAGAAAALLLLTQLPAGLSVARAWRTPDFAGRMGLPDLSPALQELEALQITHAVASYGAAYRLTHSSDGAVQAAQPFNERFPGWPVPYQDEVDAAPSVAYVLTDAIRFLKPSVFERHLRTMNVTSTVVTAGAFRIYHDFKPPPLGPHHRMPPALISAAASPGTASPDLFNDGQRETAWRAQRPQQAGDWIELTWPVERPLEGLLLVYGQGHGTAETMTLWLRCEDRWQEWPLAIPGEPDKFELHQGRPRYGSSVRWIDLQCERVNGARLEITAARDGRDWNVAEIEVYQRLAKTNAP